MKGLIRDLSGLTLVLLLGGCSLLPKSEPVDVYLLPAASVVPVRAAPLAWSLRISRPQASQSLDSPRIAVVPRDNLLSSYAGARWSNPVPSLLRNHLLDAFLSDGRITALSSDESNLQADFELSGELGAFQVEYREGQPQALIRFDAHLIQGASQRIVASRRFEVREPLQGKQVADAVTALGRASDRLATEMLAWTLQTTSNGPG